MALSRVVPSVISQHAEMAAHLHRVRSLHVYAPRVKLANLLRIDNRLAAHLDGLFIAGEVGAALCGEGLDNPEPGAAFASAVGTVERQDQPGIARLLALAGASPDVLRGLIGAYGWVESGMLKGIVARALSSGDPLARLAAVAACGLHRVDPGLASGLLIMDTNSMVRARALRCAGEVGCRVVVPACEAALRHEDADVQFWAAWSAVLLGNRTSCLEALARTGRIPGVRRARAFRLVLQAAVPAKAHRLLQEFAGKAEDVRWLIQGSGIRGDPAYVPWLIGHMSDERTARPAGEAFSLITGVDLPLLDLERKPPADFESGPNDDPDDPDVDMDDDDGLPWPDPEKIAKWWAFRGSDFQKGARYFMGAPVTREHCIEVLKTGYQRQRVLAANYLCLLHPGTPLFNTAAPAWRQNRWLEQMQ